MFLGRKLLGLLCGLTLIGYVWYSWSSERTLCDHTSSRDRGVECGRMLVRSLINPLIASKDDIPSDYCCSHAYLEAIVDMMAYLDSLAEDKGQQFTEGTFVIEDHSGRLFAFLRSYPEVYMRRSSHFGEYRVKQYGLDIPRRSRSHMMFPRNKRHILFGQLTPSLIFIKPENYGTSLSVPSDYIMHAKEYIQYLARTCACIGFERADWREERIPTPIITAWRDFLACWTHNKQYARMLYYRARSVGIKIIAQHVPLITSTIECPTALQQAVYNHLIQLLEDYDHCHLRKGREVVLPASELLGV
jgi:hypothetical protein